MRLVLLLGVATILSSLTLSAQGSLHSSTLRRRFHRTGPFSAGSGRSIGPVRRRAGRAHPRGPRAASCCRTTFLDLRRHGARPAASGGCSGWRLRPTRQAAGFFVNFTNRSGDTVVARFRRSANPLIADAIVALRSAVGRRRPAFIAQPFRQSQRRPPRVRARRLPLHRPRRRRIGRRSRSIARRIRRSCSARCCASTSTCPTRHPDRVSGSGRQSVRRRRRASRARPEIWAFGLRNPWRYSFDDPARGGTGALVIGDVGQDAWEEIDYEPAGPRRPQLRLAQPRRRARQRHVTRRRRICRSTDPIHEYDHSAGQSITGGYVYRGARSGSAFAGRYFFADYVQGRVWSLALTVDAQAARRARRTDRAHGRARRLEHARQHQLVRRRRRRRAVHRQLL